MVQTKNLLRGTLNFDRDPRLTADSKIRVVVEDFGAPNADIARIVEKEIDFDPDKLSVFKYSTFEIGNFEMEKDRKYNLAAHVDVNGNGKVEDGDFITSQIYPVTTGLEQFDLQVTRL